MKRLAIASIVLSVVLLSGCDSGSVFNGEQAHTDATTRIESAGLDLRVYEFTPKTQPTYQCIFVAGSSKGGLECFKKPEGK